MVSSQPSSASRYHLLQTSCLPPGTQRPPPHPKHKPLSSSSHMFSCVPVHIHSNHFLRTWDFLLSLHPGEVFCLSQNYSSLIDFEPQKCFSGYVAIVTPKLIVSLASHAAQPAEALPRGNWFASLSSLFETLPRQKYLLVITGTTSSD